MNTTSLIVDIAVAVFMVLLILFGTWRGMYKLIYGLVSGLVSIILAIVLMGTVTTFIVQRTELETTLNSALNETVQGALPESLEASNVQVHFTDTGITVENSEGTIYNSVSEYVADKAPTLSALGSLLDKVTANENVKTTFSTETENGETETSSPTLADLLCVTVTTYVLLAAVFLALWIVGFIVLRLLLLPLKKISTRTDVGHFLDKVLGFASGMAIGLVIVWGALAVIRLLGTYTWIISVNNIINGTTLTKWLYENNYLYTFLVETMNLQETLSGIIGSFSSFSGGGEAAG